MRLLVDTNLCTEVLLNQAKASEARTVHETPKRHEFLSPISLCIR
jgi:hypothetical protein